MAEQFPATNALGEPICDCELQRFNFEIAPDEELLTVARCKEAIKKAGGGDYTRARCGIVALERSAMFERIAELGGDPDA